MSDRTDSEVSTSTAQPILLLALKVAPTLRDLNSLVRSRAPACTSSRGERAGISGRR